MRSHRRSAASLLVLALVMGAVGCSGDEDATDTTTGTTDAADDLQATVVEVVAELGAPGAVVVVDGPDGRWETAVGLADVEAGTPMATGLRWPARSITKSFTVTLVLQLADEGALSLDDPIGDWVEGVPNGDTVTLRQLADMTSGGPDYTTQAFIDDLLADPGRVFTNDELVAYALAEPARTEPGTDRVYTNANTLLLGLVVEEAAGRPFAEVLAERILEPLGLDDTVYPTTVEDWTTDSVGYSPGEDGLEPDLVNFSVFGPAGALITTTDDLLRWGGALATGELLDPATQTARSEGGPLDEGPEYDTYALGIGELDGWWGHTGEGFGYTALVMHDEATGTTVAIAMNASQLDSHGPTTLFRRLTPLLAEE